jgi:hypothetical protein
MAFRISLEGAVNVRGEIQLGDVAMRDFVSHDKEQWQFIFIGYRRFNHPKPNTYLYFERQEKRQLMQCRTMCILSSPLIPWIFAILQSVTIAIQISILVGTEQCSALDELLFLRFVQRPKGLIFLRSQNVGSCEAPCMWCFTRRACRNGVNSPREPQPKQTSMI